MNPTKIHFQKIYMSARTITLQSKALFLELPKYQQVLITIITLSVIFGFAHIFSKTKQEETPETSSRLVTVKSVSNLSNTDTAIPLIGTVTSVSEATIRAGSSGELTRVYRKLGDYVSAGQVIAEFENSSERAQVQQAEGVYEAAKAARDITKITSGGAVSSLVDSKTNALNTLSSSYAAMDDAVRTKTDQAFSNPRELNTTFLPTVANDTLVHTLESERVQIEKMLISRNAKNKTLNVDSDLFSEITNMQKEVQIVKNYLDDLASAYSKAIPDSNYSATTLDQTRTTINNARSSLSGTLSSLTGAKTALTASKNAEASAGYSSDTGSLGAAEAQVKQALGAYNGALSRLEKTIVRSPISGTLNSLAIQTGDYVTQFSEVAVVSNNGALEVLSYVTEDDAKRIQVGSDVLIDSKVKGVITSIAPALDPRTKKIEVRIGIKDNSSALTNGQSVRIVITKNISVRSVTTNEIKIPIAALKLTPNGAFVFTVTGSSTLEAIKVQEGAILGEEIQIISGLSGDEVIVTDARGLKAGMKVTVEEK